MFQPMDTSAWNGPKWGQEDFFLLIQTLPTFWAERFWILIILICIIFWIPNLWISHLPKFPDFWNFWKSGTWASWNSESKKIKKRNIKTKSRVAQNVGKVQISRKKSSWPHLGPFQANLSMGWKNSLFFVIFLGGPMAAIHPVWTNRCYSRGLEQWQGNFKLCSSSYC